MGPRAGPSSAAAAAAAAEAAAWAAPGRALQRSARACLLCAGLSMRGEAEEAAAAVAEALRATYAPAVAGARSGTGRGRPKGSMADARVAVWLPLPLELSLPHRPWCLGMAASGVSTRGMAVEGAGESWRRVPPPTPPVSPLATLPVSLPPSSAAAIPSTEPGPLPTPPLAQRHVLIPRCARPSVPADVPLQAITDCAGTSRVLQPCDSRVIACRTPAHPPYTCRR